MNEDDMAAIIAAINEPVTATFTPEQVSELYRRLDLLDRQGVNAFTGKTVNATAIFINVDRIIALLAQCDPTGKLKTYHDALEAKRCGEAAAKLLQTLPTPTDNERNPA